MADLMQTILRGGFKQVKLPLGFVWHCKHHRILAKKFMKDSKIFPWYTPYIGRKRG